MSEVTFYQGTVVSDGHVLFASVINGTAMRRDMSADAWIGPLSKQLLAATGEHVVATVTEHRHAIGEACSALAYKSGADMTDCYAWSWVRNIEGLHKVY